MRLRTVVRLEAHHNMKKRAPPFNTNSVTMGALNAIPPHCWGRYLNIGVECLMAGLAAGSSYAKAPLRSDVHRYRAA